MSSRPLSRSQATPCRSLTIQVRQRSWAPPADHGGLRSGRLGKPPVRAVAVIRIPVGARVWLTAGRDGHAARLCDARGAGRGDAKARSLCRASVRLPLSAGQPDQDDLVRRPGIMPVIEETGEGSLRMAVGQGRPRGSSSACATATCGYTTCISTAGRISTAAPRSPSATRCAPIAISATATPPSSRTSSTLSAMRAADTTLTANRIRQSGDPEISLTAQAARPDA